MWQALLPSILQGDSRAVARGISFIENEQPGYTDLLAALPHRPAARIIGITGPPGAGKSTLTDGLVGVLVQAGKKVAVVCVDPSSPFHLGAVLGDRIRMSSWYTHPQVFIRSLATRGSMGGLNPKIIEITDLLKAAGYDYILVETVGVGQSETEIAGQAHVTLVVVVPEGGDEVQTMKAGLMEIADIFVVNKSDRPGADHFVRNLRQMLAPAFSNRQAEIPIIPTIAAQQQGIDVLYQKIREQENRDALPDRHLWPLTERAWQLIQQKRMKDIDRSRLREQIRNAAPFNLYRFVAQF